MADPNLPLLIAAATVLRPMLNELVFVGGCTTGLLVTDPGLAPVRATFDVDAVVEITSYAGYADLSVRLRALGLTEDTDAEAPLCRWKYGDVRIDVMPLEENILGFSNRWYRQAIDTAESVELKSDLSVRAITAPYFVATKLEAYRSRGGGRFLGSHDLEDVISLLDGRESLVQEILNSHESVRTFIQNEFDSMLRETTFKDALPGFLPPDDASQDRVAIILSRMQEAVSD